MEVEIFPEDDFETLYEQEMEIQRELESQEEENNAYCLNTLESQSVSHSKSSLPETKDSLPNIDSNTAKRTLFCTQNQEVSSNLEDFTSYDTDSTNERSKRPLLQESLSRCLGSPNKKKIKLSAPRIDLCLNEKDKKRKELQEEEDRQILDRVSLYRKNVEISFLKETNHLNGKNGNSSSSFNFRKVKFHRHLPAGEFQSITTVNGQRFYLDMKNEDEFDHQINSVSNNAENIQLLPVSFSSLMSDARKELALLQSQGALILDEETNIIPSSDSSQLNGDSEDTKDLWVTKYQPQSYFDLLSDESTNRCVLQWMKLWDKLVFRREKKIRNKENVPKVVNKFSKFQNLKKKGPEIIEEFDEFGRPQQKVILLCGPPGLGKTTLAHIIARHAGYNVVEMNASDDRNVEGFKKMIENATSMKAVFGDEKRPNCLIIDEIEGACAASINFLVSILQGKATAGKKKKDEIILRRPVICICNDLYALSLRPLRQMALIIPFPPTQQARLAQRLLSISLQQRLKADLSVLMALCDKTENDIRSCLAVLQFVRSTNGELRLVDLDGVAVGQKDYQRSLFSVWHDIFTIPRLKKKRRGNPHALPAPGKGQAVVLEKTETSNDNTSLSSRFNQIHRTSLSCGEYDKLTLGWFENYLHIKFKHTNLDAVVKGLEWATFGDTLQREVNQHQNWTLIHYVPYSFVAYHMLFASHVWPKIKYPSQHSEHVAKVIKSRSMISLLTVGMSVNTLLFTPSQLLIRDVLPYLMIIVQLPFRPVNVQLFSKQEKENLSRLVDIMISYNLTYQQERTIEGHYSFNIDPNVSEIVYFPELPQSHALTYSAKQVIAREIELEKVRRSEKYFEKLEKKDQEKKPKTFVKLVKKSTPEVDAKTVEPKIVPNHLQKLKAIKPVIPEKETVVRDFFGKIIEPSNYVQKKGIKAAKNPNAVWFRFKEGYTNAFRDAK